MYHTGARRRGATGLTPVAGYRDAATLNASVGGTMELQTETVPARSGPLEAYDAPRVDRIGTAQDLTAGNPAQTQLGDASSTIG